MFRSKHKNIADPELVVQTLENTLMEEPSFEEPVVEKSIDQDALVNEIVALSNDYYKNGHFNNPKNARELLIDKDYDLEECKDTLEEVMYRLSYELNNLIDYAKDRKIIRYEDPQSIIDLWREKEYFSKETKAEIDRAFKQEEDVRFEARYSEFKSWVRYTIPGFDTATFYSTETVADLQKKINDAGPEGLVAVQSCLMKNKKIIKRDLCMRGQDFKIIREFILDQDINRN